MLGHSTRVSLGSIRIVAAIAVAAAGAWACELEGDPPTQLPLAEAERAIQQAYCDRMFECSCDGGRRYDERDACDERIDERIALLREEVDGNDVTYDPACLGRLVDQLDDRGCEPAQGDGEPDACTPACNPLFGGKALGEPCVDLTFGSDCAQGLVCEYDCDDDDCFERCSDPCGGVCGACDDDERCDPDSRNCVPRPAIGESCDAYPCAGDAACRFDENAGTSRCVAAPTEGESCFDTGSCAEGLLCTTDPTSGDATCVAMPAQGDPCTGHSQCTTGFCPAGFCDTLPELGESCAGTSACGDGLQCDFEKLTCVAADSAVCRQDLPYF